VEGRTEVVRRVSLGDQERREGGPELRVAAAVEVQKTQQ